MPDYLAGVFLEGAEAKKPKGQDEWPQLLKDTLSEAEIETEVDEDTLNSILIHLSQKDLIKIVEEKKKKKKGKKKKIGS